jgi:hypothetical protein
VGKQRLECSKIAVFCGGEEPSCQLVALSSCCLETGPTPLDVSPGAGGELAHVVLVLAHDRLDLRIPVVEHVVKQQHRFPTPQDKMEAPAVTAPRPIGLHAVVNKCTLVSQSQFVIVDSCDRRPDTRRAAM